VIADVSDKGMPAALYMALTRSLILAEARRSESPRQVLTSVHNLLLELGEPDMFVTVFYGVIDGPSRRLTYVRAGHDRPILLRNGQDLSLGGEGIFLGLAGLDALHLSEEKVDLKAGDRLVLYTDGLIDILSTQQTSYGLARLKTLLRESANMSAEQLCDVVFDVLNAFRGDALQYDDMTMLVAAIE
jgi:sigma-B regulation protein RsbU (phosphoserine phosphatase)